MLFKLTHFPASINRIMQYSSRGIPHFSVVISLSTGALSTRLPFQLFNHFFLKRVWGDAAHDFQIVRYFAIQFQTEPISLIWYQQTQSGSTWFAPGSFNSFYSLRRSYTALFRFFFNLLFFRNVSKIEKKLWKKNWKKASCPWLWNGWLRFR
jgi:hypothetical protein